MKLFRTVGFLGALSLIGGVGCQHHPDLEPVSLELPLSWESSEAGGDLDRRLDWAVYGDATLVAWIERALERNLDLAMAMERLEESRAQTRGVRSALVPDLSATPGYNSNRLSQNNRQLSQFGGGAGPAAINLQASQWRVPLDLSYELDVFDRVRQAIEAATFNDAAQALDVQALRNTVASEVARLYFRIAGLDGELEILDAMRETLEHTLAGNRRRVAAGLDAESVVLSLQGDLAALNAEAHDLEGQREDLISGLALLCGQAGMEAEFATEALRRTPPTLPAGLPSRLLHRRPDVASAEASLEAAAAEVGVARAQFLPSIRLTGSAGLESVSLTELVSMDSRFWSLGPDVSIPIDLGGGLKADLAAATSRWAQAKLAFQQTALTAFQETHSALRRLGAARNAHEATESGFRHASENLALMGRRTAQGLESELDLLGARYATLQEERRARRSLATLYGVSVELFKALGGGWGIEALDASPSERVRLSLVD